MKALIFVVLLGTLLPVYSHAYYQAEQGRWLSRDPIGERGGKNLNAFVRNRPISKIDILGLMSTQEMRDFLGDMSEEDRKRLCCAADDTFNDPENKERSGGIYTGSEGNEHRPESGPAVGPPYEEGDPFASAVPPGNVDPSWWQSIKNIWGPENERYYDYGGEIPYFIDGAGGSGNDLDIYWHTHPDPDLGDPGKGKSWGTHPYGPSHADKDPSSRDDLVLEKGGVHHKEPGDSHFTHLGSLDDVLGCDELCCDK